MRPMRENLVGVGQIIRDGKDQYSTEIRADKEEVYIVTQILDYKSLAYVKKKGKKEK